MRKLLMLLMVAAFAMACDDPKKDAKEGDAPKGETTAKAGGDAKPEDNKGKETAEAADEDEEEPDITDEEVAEVAAAAAAEVTADNAEAEAAALEKELEAELGDL